MRAIIILAVLLLLVNVLSAISVTYEQALKATEHQISVHDKIGYTISEYFEIKDSNEIILAYVFNLQPTGFIATSTETDIYPVIGYSFLNNFSNLDISENIGYQYLKNDMILRREAILFSSENLKQSNRILWKDYLNGTYIETRNRNEIYPAPGYSPTEGWIDTQWHEDEPYNSLCPLDPENMERCLAGCTATSMMQILHYHRWIGDAGFDDSDDYFSNTTNPPIHIDDDYLMLDFPSFPQLNTYLDELIIAYGNYDIPSEDMVAALSFASGVSTLMGYTSTASGAWVSEAYNAILTKFDYDTATYTGYGYFNNEFYEALQLDMIEARPAILAAYSSPEYGHSFICDGYNGNDNTFHLNMGWGGNSDGWYSLPENIPEGLTLMAEAVTNIEDGTIPFTVTGAVFATGAPVEETQITLDGPRFHEISLDENGYFAFPILFPAEYEITAIIELTGGGYFYKNDVVALDENNILLIIELDDFTEITGSVSADINTENTHINIYSGDEQVSSGIADANGNFSIPGVLPGNYTASASLNGNYFDSQFITISADNQHIDFQLDEYHHDTTFNFAGDPVGQLQLYQDMSCAIQLSGDDLIEYEEDIFSQLEFIAPFNPDEGELYAQIWKNDILLCEQQVNDFTEGEWLEVVYEALFEINVTAEYYIGYRIHSLTGNVAAVYHDAGPMITGNGAYIYTSSWMELPLTYNYNFCIKAIAASQTLSGDNDNLIPKVTKLFQNYPNPFNPTTTIKYSLKENSKVTLNIYSIKGQKVKQLFSDRVQTGQHSVAWNGIDDNNKPVSSGIYFYKLKTGIFEKTKKMILIK